MKQNVRHVCLLVTLFALLQCAPRSLAAAEAPAVSPTLEQLIRRSSYMFVGTVQKINAVSISLLSVSDRTVVVHIAEVLYAPKTTTDLSGQTVTIQLSEPRSVKPGQRAVFFTNGGLFGDGIALVEVGHLEIGQDAKALRQQIAEVHQKEADEDLQTRMRSAEVVVTGKVLMTRRAKLPEHGPFTEHDPDWYEAEILVQSVEKGQFQGQGMRVLFANSDDVMWDRAPKLKEGQEGIWILHKDEVKWPGIEGRYTAVNTLDFQPKDQLERVRVLLKAIPLETGRQ